MGQPAPQYSLYSPSEAPLQTHQEWLADIMGQQGLHGDERPVYTRQQVKGMLDVVSDCFIESVVSQPYLDSHIHFLSFYSAKKILLTKIICYLLGKRLE